MQFKVPQFLDIEDKIFGPFTFKQFVYLVGGAGLCYVLFQWLGLLLGLIPILAIASFSGALAFYRPNNKPFIDMIESGFKYMFQNKLYIWKRKEVKKQIPSQISTSENNIENRDKNTNRLGDSKLRDLAWSLDVLDLKK
ncbi:MAG: PrgI family protein [Candidatus Paceibacterota bacterium]